MRLYLMLIVALSLSACSGPSRSVPPAEDASRGEVRRLDAATPIKHVVIIVQENRTVDNLFNGFPGADTVRSGRTSEGRVVALRPIHLDGYVAIAHAHDTFVTEYAAGRVDGFNLAKTWCSHHAQCQPTPYGYVPKTDVEPYWDMAREYTLADHLFQTNQGPSFPAHQYLVSGTSTISNDSLLRAAENASMPNGKGTGGCDSPTGSHVAVIDPQGEQRWRVYPCFDRLSLMGEANHDALSWRYYQAVKGAGIWNAPDALRAIRYSNSYENVVAPSKRILEDVARGDLANITWVTPTLHESDHAGSNKGTGPSWVASVVNAIGESPYWKSTAIFVLWDDWGGWYDHVAPKQENSYELGFRVPLLVISPYAKPHYVSHVPHEFGSILKFAEETFGLPSMKTTDERSDDLSDCFNFHALPRKFTKIRAKYSSQYFLHQPADRESPAD
ncbi:MAG: alkaline phosphatase family protein [Candidatus Cybelea sp.]